MGRLLRLLTNRRKASRAGPSSHHLAVAVKMTHADHGWIDASQGLFDATMAHPRRAGQQQCDPLSFPQHVVQKTNERTYASFQQHTAFSRSGRESLREYPGVLEAKYVLITPTLGAKPATGLGSGVR